MSTPHRIALSGSAGTGKTTLGRRLAQDLGLPFIEEGMRARLENGLILHGLEPKDWRVLMEDLWSEQAAAQEAALESHKGYIADRSSLDFAAFWLHYGLYEDAEHTEDFIARMVEAAQTYDRVLLFPWGVLHLQADGVRSTNKWIQLRFQGIVERVLEQYLPEGVLHRIATSEDLEQRVGDAREHLPTDS